MASHHSAPDRERRTLLFVVGVSPSRVGGMEILTREICSQVAARGWRTVLAFEGAPSDAVREYLLGAGNVEFRAFPRQAGLKLEHIGRLGRLLSETRPQLVVYAFNGILRLFPWQARLQAGARVVYYDHSSKPTGYVPAPMAAWKRWAGRMLTWPVGKTTAVAGYTGRCLAVQGLYPGSRIVTVYNGVETSRTPAPDAGPAFRSRFGIAADRTLVTQVSWLVPEKGIDVFLEAAQTMAASGVYAHFAIVGDGPHGAEYRRMAVELGLEDRVTFTGPIASPTMEGVFEAADICCQLSQWEEACPLAVQEAMAAGKPVVASRVGGIPELVEDEVTGYLVDRRSPEDAARKISMLAQDAALRSRVGAAARERAERLFDLKKNVTRLLDEWGL